MYLSDFQIGREFMFSEQRWRCTDIGTRVAIAIRIDEQQVTSLNKAGLVATQTISGVEAEAQGWFEGPPYASPEHVFDEDDMAGCEPI